MEGRGEGAVLGTTTEQRGSDGEDRVEVEGQKWKG
jgi:hypothetical protein